MMTKFHLIAKVTLNILGIYSLYLCLSQFGYLAFYPGQTGTLVWVVKTLIATTVLVILLAVFYNVFFVRNGWILRMVGEVQGCEQPVSDKQILAGLRLGLVFCGVLIIVYNADFITKVPMFLIYGPKILVDMIVYKYVDNMFNISIYAYLRGFTAICKLALGIYLAFGAPHFVKWQMKKLRQSAAKIGENYAPLQTHE
jgi:hypothetical protein